jgi:hypothetical protein
MLLRRMTESWKLEKQTEVLTRCLRREFITPEASSWGM